MLEIVHYLHLLSGTIWAGGAVAIALIVEPTVFRLEPNQIRAYSAGAPRFVAPVMASAGTVLLLTGLARPVVGGGVRSFSDIATPYGLLAGAAFLVVMVVAVYGEHHRAAVARLLAAAGDPRAELIARSRANAVVTGTGIAVILGIMATLGLGLY